MTPYATIEEYRSSTDDTSSSDSRVTYLLEELSAELDAECAITTRESLSEVAKVLCRALVCDAARKALVPPIVGGVGAVVGATQATFSANGFSGSYQMQNPSGSAYFDRAKLARLKRLLGCAQKIGVLRC